MSRKKKQPSLWWLAPALILPMAAVAAWALIHYGAAADELFRVALKLAVIP